VPGGLGSGVDLERRFDLAKLGYVQVRYCPPGRGAGTSADPRSEGREDHNGFVGQDGLKAAIEAACDLPGADPSCIGILSGSFGISLTAGALGRYPDLPVQYVVDLEGPSDSEVICLDPWQDPERQARILEMFGHLSIAKDPSSENVRWWREREAIHYIGSMRAAYLRVQTDEDHAQPPGFAKSAIDLTNLATLGASPWTRINGADVGNPVNVTYDTDDPDRQPRLLHGHLRNHAHLEARYVSEMTALVRKKGL
jgi:hypothetical protein